MFQRCLCDELAFQTTRVSQARCRLLSARLSDLHWGCPEQPAEGSRHMRMIGKADSFRNLLQREFGITDQLDRAIDATTQNILVRAQSGGLAKSTTQMPHA